MNYAALKTELNIQLGDTDNFAFTSEEKDSILTEAIQDSFVVKKVSDISLLFVTDTWEYDVPSTITVINDVSIQVDTTQDPETIALPYQVVARKLQFKGRSNLIPDGSTIFIRGSYKYTVSDTIAEIRLQQYVLKLAQIIAMDEIGIKKILKFVKNDTSVSEIIAIKRELERKVSQHRASLPREFQAA